MMRRLVVRPQAQLELAEVTDWYDAQDKRVGDELLRTFESSIETIMRNLFQDQPMYRNARSARLGKFPYGLIYTVSDSEIVIISCFHGRRGPNEWRKKLR